jgi:hypothetical protein
VAQVVVALLKVKMTLLEKLEKMKKANHGQEDNGRHKGPLFSISELHKKLVTAPREALE